MSASLLLVSNRKDGRRIREAVAPVGFHLRQCESGSAAIELALQSPPDLVLVCAGADPSSVLQLCRSLRAVEETSVLALVVLAPSASPGERLAILEAGADDCWTEDVARPEFLLRLRAFARRTEAAQATRIIRYADVELDLDRYRARRNGAPVDLTAMQLKLLKHLMENPTIVFSRRQLLRQVWQNSKLDEGAVTACVARLRRALQKAGGPDLIKSIPSAGYALDASVAFEDQRRANS